MPMQRKPRYFALSTVAAHGTGFRQPMLPLKLLEDAWRLQRPVSLAVQRDKFIPNPFHVPEGQEQRAAHKNDTKMLVQAFKCKVFRVIGSCCSLNGTKHGQGLAAQKNDLISHVTACPNLQPPIAKMNNTGPMCFPDELGSSVHCRRCQDKTSIPETLCGCGL